DSHWQLDGTVGGDPAQLVAYPGVAKPSQQRRPIVSNRVWRQSEMTTCLVPQRLDPRSAVRVGDRLIDRDVAADAAGVREQRVRGIQQPELALFVRGDVVDEAGASVLPGRPTGRKGAGD